MQIDVSLDISLPIRNIGGMLSADVEKEIEIQGVTQMELHH